MCHIESGPEDRRVKSDRIVSQVPLDKCHKRAHNAEQPTAKGKRTQAGEPGEVIIFITDKSVIR